MKKLLYIWMSILVATPLCHGQGVTFSEDISPIIYNHCSGCHRLGEVAPMPLTNFTQVANYGPMIKYVTGIKYMPPWKADPTFRHYLDENILTDDEIQAIADWVDGGMPQGDPATEAPFPTFPSGSQLGTPDLVLSMSEAFVHFGNNQDQYQAFVLPTGLTEDKDIVAMELRVGNKALMHHSLLAVDTTGGAAALDAQDPRYGYEAFSGFKIEPAAFYTGWAPGSRARFLPKGIGQKLFKNSDFLLQMHYAPIPIQDTDSTSVNFFFADGPINRTLTTRVMYPSSIVNGSFDIPANTVKTFHGIIDVPQDVSMVWIGPDMHLLGKKWEVFSVTLNNDTIPLIRINDWDFNWQRAYYFEELVKISAGSQIHAFATYDNTSGNPLNPNHPPQDMGWGNSTTDEMFYMLYAFVPYQIGDEYLKLSDDGMDEILYGDKIEHLPVSEVDKGLDLKFKLQKSGKVDLKIYDLEMKVVRSELNNVTFPPGSHNFSIDYNQLSRGLYQYILNVDGFTSMDHFRVN